MIADDEDFKRRVDAIHESGHAVVATALGLTVVRIEAHGGTGFCQTERTNNFEDHARVVMAGAALGLAGPLAVFKRYGEETPYRDLSREDHSAWKPNTDFEFWRELSPDQQTRAFVIADYLLDLHWRNVLALADEVFEKGVITESSWLQHIPNWWDFPVVSDRREVVVHRPEGDERRVVQTTSKE